MFLQNIKISIAACRVNAQMSQKEFAEKLGVSAATVSNWESGRTEPTVTELRNISSISGIPMDFIFVQH